MKVRFWGTRGSLAKASKDTLRFGGNTSCVEIRSESGTLLVIDCGTGAHELGVNLMSSSPQPIRGSMLISHTHWDHIQGIPFFAPLFVPGNEWDIYAPRGLRQSLAETLAGQMQYTYFPVTLEALGATIRYHDLVEGEFWIDDVRIRTQYLNHPALTLGYRLEADGVAVAYACDHECGARNPCPTDAEAASHEARHLYFLNGADLVIHDAQYTTPEYANKVGWGHSTMDYAVAVCRAAGVKKLALTHHDPLRKDADVDEIVAAIRAELEISGHPLEVFAAAEGDTIDLGTASAESDALEQSRFSAVSSIGTAIEGHKALVGPIRSSAAEIVRAAADAENLPLIEAPRNLSELNDFPISQLSLVVLDVDESPEEASSISETVRRQSDKHQPQAPIVVIADEVDETRQSAVAATEWLIWPFSEQYARTKIRAWILRLKCRWRRAGFPDNEVQRIAALHKLGILDTEPEERFDRITRIAAEAFQVPTVLISLVDRDRQWFKSCVGTETTQTSREMAFCAHTILEQQVMIVPDTFLDSRFADNPLVTGEFRIRFYAGCPLNSVDGFPLGTLCLIDARPRDLDERQIDLLRDLARLVERELAIDQTHIS